MDSQTIWVLVLAIATPISGAVGFAIQLRQIKKTRLENEKLQLEIAALRDKAAASGRRIVDATTEEVKSISYRGPLFSRGSARDSAPLLSPSRAKLKDIALVSTAIFILLLLVVYLLYDLYRLASWVHSHFW